jgi:ATP-dependent Clp protease ATP-binding subunit ClpA
VELTAAGFHVYDYKGEPTAMADASETGRIHRLDPEALEGRLRDAARRLMPDRVMDELEVRHLARVISECSLLLADVYSDRRLAHIMQPDPELITGLIDELARRHASDGSDLLQRVRRLPDDAKVVGDKALFDMGLQGKREVKGYDLADLGARAYRTAGEALEALADDRQLREFFEKNRLLMLPLEEEVVFLRQCSDQFRVYADILKNAGELHRRGGASLGDHAREIPLMAPAVEAEAPSIILTDTDDESDEGNAYLDALRREMAGDERLTREQILSAYERMLLFSSLSLGKLREALDETVIDQPQAVASLCDEFSLYAAGTRDPRKPPAYFLVGPTGVGKNHLVESLCRLLEGVWKISIPVLTIEGPNYTYPSDINELRGATRGFIRSDEEGLLTTFHQESTVAPIAVILIDEVEKAHPQLLTFFLSILDRGTTTDNRGAVLNFANCMLFFTSNLGYRDAQQRSAPIGYLDEEERQGKTDRDIRRDLRRALKPEFVNRVRLVDFNRLTITSAERILDLEFERIARRYSEIHGLRIELDESARAELIRRGFSEIFGARRLAATLESVCNVELAKKVRRDDRRVSRDRGSLVTWLRELRAGKRAFSAAEVRERVLKKTRARLGYDTVRISFDGEGFVYEGSGEGQD